MTSRKKVATHSAIIARQNSNVLQGRNQFFIQDQKISNKSMVDELVGEMAGKRVKYEI